MTARDIQRTLMRGRFAKSKVWPNYTPNGWFECDLIEITSAGYFIEYEIKISRADFRADFDKARPDWSKPYRFGMPQEMLNKHDRLNTDLTDATPRRFYFVVPEGMIDREHVPHYAGLITIKPGRSRLDEYEVVRAPDRHRQKLPQAILEHARGICYWRWHRLLQAQK